MNMFKYIQLFLFLILFAGCTGRSGRGNPENAMPAGEGEVAEISFGEYEYDFGKILEGEKVAHIFSFENKGPGNLVIRSVSTTCGCTVPKYDKSPIPPGGKGKIEVLFDSGGRSGIQTKTISVKSNSKTDIIVLKITADVLIPEDQQ